MNRQSIRLLLIAAFWLAFPLLAPAPLIYRPGEGWTYEPVGGEGKWMQSRAKDQLEVAQAAFDKKAYSLALKAARRVVRVWPLSDYAPKAQYLLARCYEAKGLDEKAFNEYQTMLEKYPKVVNYEEILQRQYDITNRYLAGQWFKLWDYVPVPPWISAAMDRTASMYEKVVKNGPYSQVGPEAQMKLGATRDKQAEYPQAVKAYELAADRYHDRPQIAADAIFHAGLSRQKEAQGANMIKAPLGRPSPYSLSSSRSIRTTRGCRRPRRSSPRSRASKPGAALKRRSSTSATRDGTAPWSITTKCWCRTPIPRTRLRPVSGWTN